MLLTLWSIAQFFILLTLLKTTVSLPYPIDLDPYSSGLVAYYRFEDDVTGKIATDSSPFRRHASLNSVGGFTVYSRGRALGGDIMNDGYGFPYSNSPLTSPYITFPSFPLTANELTVSFAFETRDTTRQTVFSIEFSPNNNNRSVVAYLDNDFMTLDFFGAKVITLATKFQVRALYHFVFVVNANSMNFYVNGEHVSHTYAERSFDFGPYATLQLGYSNRVTSYCSSLFDEVIIWNKVLPSQNIIPFFEQLAIGSSTCDNYTLIDADELYSSCGKDRSLYDQGKEQIRECGWKSSFRSKGFTCGQNSQTAAMNTTSGPYAFRFIDVAQFPTFVSLSFKLLDLCRTTDPNENMEDYEGLCKRDGKYIVMGLCAFDNHCINVGIETAAQRFFFHSGYYIDLNQPMIEFGRVTRPMYLEYPEGALIYMEMYDDQTLWISTSSDGISFDTDVQGHRLNLPFPYHYYNLLRLFTASQNGETGTTFSSFSYYSEKLPIEEPQCPEREFFNGYDCQKCVDNSYSPAGSETPDQCQCEMGYFADRCRNSPLCTGTYPGFSFISMNQPQYAKVLGSASISGDLALLTPNAANQGGAYFFEKPWKLFDFSSPDFPEISFSTHFVFLISDNGGSFFPSNGKWGADGMAFVMSNMIPAKIPQGSTIGYAGLTKSIVIEFDTFKNNDAKDISDSHVGININGNTVSSVQAQYDGLKDGKPIHCWISYDAAHGKLDVKLSPINQEPIEPLLSYPVEVERIIGGPDMYVGFTAATGGQYSNHYVLKWEFEMKPQLSCSPCGANSYKDLIGNSQCKACPIGSETLGKSASTSISSCLCDPGLYMENGECKSCPINTYNPNYGSTSCQNCPIHSSTKGNQGSRSCICDYGYILENGQCVDFDECSSPEVCLNGASCVNRDGSYYCICAPGFSGQYCSFDINECVTEPCMNGGTCVNNFGSFYCMCPSGWTRNTCMEDINECLFTPDPCSPNANCTNTLGSYFCTCVNGLVGDGRICEMSKGPKLVEPSSTDIYARYLRLEYVPEPHFNATSLILEIDFTEERDAVFEIDMKRTYPVTRNPLLIIEDLPPYTSMKMRLIALSGTFSSPSSNVIFFRTQATSPDPGTLSYSKGNDGRSVTIKWHPGSPNGARVVGYKIFYHKEKEQETTNVTADPTLLSIQVNKLEPNVTYIFYMVTLASDFPDSNPSEILTVFVDGIPDVIIIEPTDLPPVESKKSKVGMIVGICISLIVLAALVLFALFYMKKNRTGRIRLPDSNASASSKANVGLLSPLDDSLNVPDAFKDDVDEDATEKDID